MVKAVLFDLDNTLYEYARCKKAAEKSVANKLSKIFNKSNEEVESAFDKALGIVKLWLKGTSASHSRFLYLQKTIEILKGSTDIRLTQELHELYWKSYFKEMELYDGVVEFLEKLKKAGIKIVIVTNLLADIQFKKLAHLKLDKYVDLVVTSEEAGRDKPEEPIFRLALEKLGMGKDDVILIGDDADRDGKGAETLGIRYIRMDGDFKSVVKSFKSFASV